LAIGVWLLVGGSWPVAGGLKLAEATVLTRTDVASMMHSLSLQRHRDKQNEEFCHPERNNVK